MSSVLPSAALSVPRDSNTSVRAAARFVADSGGAGDIAPRGPRATTGREEAGPAAARAFRPEAQRGATKSSTWATLGTKATLYEIFLIHIWSATTRFGALL